MRGGSISWRTASYISIRSTFAGETTTVFQQEIDQAFTTLTVDGAQMRYSMTVTELRRVGLFNC